MWQCYTDKFLELSFHEVSDVVISKIPEIHINSTPDLTGPICTIIGTAIASGLTAYIAWKSIRASKEQMLQQQIIINRQNFIDELRTKISKFLADAEKLSLMLKRDVMGKSLTLETINAEKKAELNEIAHSLDLSYYYIMLMIEGKSQFEEMLHLIKKIECEIGNSIKYMQYRNIDTIAKRLIEVTIKCIETEWNYATKLRM